MARTAAALARVLIAGSLADAIMKMLKIQRARFSELPQKKFSAEMTKQIKKSGKTEFRQSSSSIQFRDDSPL
jgi:hypothetical protein